ncbi:tetratricopeptide repeat protein, partial [bacterium]|nr:tetratricopeptide repeat protein [bacterium]
KDAAFVYRKFLEMEDSNPEMFFRLGKVYDVMKSKRAEPAYSSAVDLDKKNPKYKEALADFWMKNGKKKDAIKLYREAISLGAKGWNTYYQIGLIDFGSGKYESVVKNMKKALSLNRKLPLAKMALSASYLRLNNYAECVKINNEIIREDKKNDSAYFNNACSYAMLKKDDEALKALKMAVKLDPENKKIASSSKMFERLKKNKEFLEIVKE